MAKHKIDELKGQVKGKDEVTPTVADSPDEVTPDVLPRGKRKEPSTVHDPRSSKKKKKEKGD